MSNILDKIDFGYDVSTNQDKCWTRYHRCYECDISRLGVYWTGIEYQCNIESVPTKEYVLESLLCDMDAYESSVDLADFLFEFGYCGNIENLRKGIKAYDACKRTTNMMHAMFSNEELEELREILEI